MAKKLPKKELDKIKNGDFPAPHWKVPPGQTSLAFGDDTRARKNTKNPAGRPRKHDKPGRSVSFWLTEDAIKKLRTKAAARGITAPDLLHELIEAL